MPKERPASVRRSISARAIAGLVRKARHASGTPASSSRAGSLVQLSGRNKRSAIGTGTSPLASVIDTSVWQLAFLDRQSVVKGKSVSVRLVLGGRRIIKKKKEINKITR